MRTAWKGLKLGFWIAAYVAHAFAGRWIIRDERARRRFYLENISRYARRGLRALEIKIETEGDFDGPLSRGNHLVVSNHLSYLDILCLASIHPCLFVTSVDMGETPVLGTLAELGGSIFVERRHRGQLEQDLSEITRALRDGFDVVIYPEGTSSNGTGVLPFKKSLLMAAPRAGVPILPLVIDYYEIDGRPFGRENRDKVCWYGEMRFLPHLVEVLRCRSIRVRLTALAPIRTGPECSRDQLASESYQAVSGHYCWS